ncbi:MAG: lipid-binding SYLF domain-containing protein [Verrucomicrobiota bacterium]|nr:lipid-binding SYLF domain-containing protein [Verrucomicrobiota bacterium]
MNMTQKIFTLGVSLMAITLGTGVLHASSIQDTVVSATEILGRKQGSAHPIPPATLQKAKGIAILSITKAGLVVGGAGGDGVVMVRGAAKSLSMPQWSAPIPVGYTGGSFGAQIGVSSINMIILLNSESAVKIFTQSGKLNWNATASGTVGSDSGSEHKGGMLSDQDVTIYKETDGLYGGATIGGAELNIQTDRIDSAYGQGVTVSEILSRKVNVPDYSRHLYEFMDGKH